ncbi:hypothetical protein PanWU01x14_075430 [Parasponia andersonii]|uniref:Uncharacterized protein n=1 Tax=Parasponia andersonii TaxID=3476 RepID=A0A2P5DCT8_PARAD|nr:hypothetical protein PanWU01x14_075430 [Parasponia andersonii]
MALGLGPQNLVKSTKTTGAQSTPSLDGVCEEAYKYNHEERYSLLGARPITGEYCGSQQYGSC